MELERTTTCGYADVLQHRCYFFFPWWCAVVTQQHHFGLQLQSARAILIWVIRCAIQQPFLSATMELSELSFLRCLILIFGYWISRSNGRALRFNGYGRRVGINPNFASIEWLEHARFRAIPLYVRMLGKRTRRMNERLVHSSKLCHAYFSIVFNMQFNSVRDIYISHRHTRAHACGGS
jgi:uncharacterized membrane protein YagU involved in acid resistance